MLMITIGGYTKLYIIVLKNKNVRLREPRSFAFKEIAQDADYILQIVSFFYYFSDRRTAVAHRLSLAHFYAFAGGTNYARVRCRRKETDDKLRR